MRRGFKRHLQIWYARSCTCEMKVSRALLSCSDKRQLEEFASGLVELGIELLASGGTAATLKGCGIAVTPVEQFAGLSELLGGRVKTLHPKLHAGILARRDDPAHVKAVGADGLIDLVVVNLYPFEDTAAKKGVLPADAIEQIDIGGVALIRAAAKNFEHVAVVCRPGQYADVLGALKKANGALSLDLTKRLAVEAFALTSRYDAAIAAYLGAPGSETPSPELPMDVTLRLRKQQDLRYGENPHQRGAWFVSAASEPGLARLKQLQGKELSYNNLLDMDAAFRAILECTEPAAVVVKHASLCGLAASETVEQAYAHAYACDPESAFGGIVGINRPIGAKLAEQLAETFLEVVIAPSVEPNALGIFAKKKNLRVVSVPWPESLPQAIEWRELLGGWLAQDRDRLAEAEMHPKIVTKRAPTQQELADMRFAWMAVKHAKSNGIVLVKNQATVGIGQGQPSRIGSVRIAVEKAGERAQGAVAASDAFFPFPDGVLTLAKAGVTAVIHPGGSVRDAEVVQAADAMNLAMVLTGVRHFRH